MLDQRWCVWAEAQDKANERVGKVIVQKCYATRAPVHTGFVRSLSSWGLSPWISIFRRNLFSKSSRNTTISCVQYFILIYSAPLDIVSRKISNPVHAYSPCWIWCEDRSLNLLPYPSGEVVWYMRPWQCVAGPRVICARNENEIRMRGQVRELCDHICQQIEWF